MTPAERIIATGLMEWREGMRARPWHAPISVGTTPYWNACRVVSVGAGAHTACAEWSGKTRPVAPGQLPDLHDGPTCRALWDLLREKQPEFVCQLNPGGMVFWYPLDDSDTTFDGPEPEALAFAFEWLKGMQS